jgi:CBS domain-containing protein
LPAVAKWTHTLFANGLAGDLAALPQREEKPATPAQGENPMLVADILRHKGRDVVTVAPTISVSEACRTLARRKIGAVVVMGGAGEVAGILSERDIVHALARDGGQALARAVGHYMTRAVATCEERNSVESIMETMTEGRFRHLPVVEDGHLRGIVSIGDIVKSRIEESEREASALKQYICAG